MFNDAPTARWIAAPQSDGNAYGVYHFRREIQLEHRPSTFIVHVSADNRYRLLVNGQFVSNGPQRSDLAYWRYDTVDLAPFLNSGDNVVAALVWNWGQHMPVGQFSHRTGFVMQANSPAEAVANTDENWRVYSSEAYSARPVTGVATGGYYAAPPGEEVDGHRHPWGWEHLAFDESAWPQAVPVAPFMERGMAPFGLASGWQLAPRTLPPMEEVEVRFGAVRRSSGVQAGLSSFVVPAHTRAEILLDQGHLTNAYAVVETSGGAGSRIALTYAESLSDSEGRKGNRNEIEGKQIVGVQDLIRPEGGTGRRYQSLWFRTYRYIQVEINTGEQPLRVDNICGIFTGYPFEERARFKCELPWIDEMWAMNWRVARLCAWETYFDTPYYEQLQYVGDTRIQSLISYYMSGDDRLAREAILHFDRSRIPDGLTASRYPSQLQQYIPPFSLLWIAMVHDYWLHCEDEEFVGELLPGIRAVLGRYEEAIDETGFVGRMPWWNFTDWTPQWPFGVPPGANDGHSTPIALMFAYAAQRAAELEDALGQSSEAARLRALVEKTRNNVFRQAWDNRRGLFMDALGVPSFSQQTNTLAILTDTVPTVAQRSLMEKILSDGSLVGASYYFGFYLREALLKCGLGDRYIEQLTPWRDMLGLGLTTTPETPEPTRSDSHAWSAHPNYGLLSIVLGIRPNAAGFRKVIIAPHLGPLKTVAGSIPHPRGAVMVSIVRGVDRSIEVEVSLPDGVDGVFEWNNHKIPLRSGAQHLRL